MTLAELINSDAQALALARSGADDACARRVNEIAPKVLTSAVYSYAGLADKVAIDVLDRVIRSVDLHIESGAPFASVVREMREKLRSDGIDLANRNSVGMLQSWAANEAFPLTEQDVATIVDAIGTRPTYSGVDVANLGLFTAGN